MSMVTSEVNNGRKEGDLRSSETAYLDSVVTVVTVAVSQADS